MEFRPVKSDDAALLRYSSLCRLCFPKTSKFSLSYFQWLYRDNPAGHAVGFDAYDKEKLVAHYVCVPSPMILHSRKAKSILSLNTATHPDYQGKGLFTKLATMTYDYAATLQFDFIYGVSNANSTSGFVRKLGFQLVAPIEARIGIGRLPIADKETTFHNSVFHKFWDPPGIAWRLGNPANRVYISGFDDGIVGFYSATNVPFLSTFAECCLDFPVEDTAKTSMITPKLFIGLLPGERCKYKIYKSIPQCLKPSPLNLIYRNLQHCDSIIEADNVLFSFLDFDAY